MTGDLFELTDGRKVPVTAGYRGVHFAAYVLRDVDGDDVEGYVGGWIVTWTDGINWWFEDGYELPWHALARLAALVAAAEQHVFMVHDPSSRGEGERHAFVVEAERFVSRTVHAFNCAPNCRGDDEANHQVW